MSYFKEDINKMFKAEKITDMQSAFGIFALDNENYENFYVDSSDARGKDVVKRIVTRFQNNNTGLPLKILFLGHYGCGKTTELYRAEKELENNHLVIRYSIADETDIVNVSYIDFIFTILNNISKAAKNNGIDIPDDVVESLYSYWNDEEITQVCDSKKIEGEASISAKLDWLTVLTAKIKGIMQTGLETKTIIRKKVEPSLRVLLSDINKLIENINRQIAPKSLLLIVEDLDKLEMTQSEELFIKHRKTITSLKINLIYTFPIFLYYSHYYNEIMNDFHYDELLSIIKIKERTGECFDKGIDTLKEIVWKRCNPDLIDDDALLFLIEKSGGSFRDLFIMISNASVIAITEEENPCDHISIRHAESSYMDFRSRKERAIKKSHIDTLVNIYNDKAKKPLGDDSDILMDLLHSMSVIEYNCERWCDLHPAIKDYLIEKGEIDAI